MLIEEFRVCSVMIFGVKFDKLHWIMLSCDMTGMINSKEVFSHVWRNLQIFIQMELIGAKLICGSSWEVIFQQRMLKCFWIFCQMLAMKGTICKSWSVFLSMPATNQENLWKKNLYLNLLKWAMMQEKKTWSGKKAIVYPKDHPIWFHKYVVFF